jgi:hypothetical protein
MVLHTNKLKLFAHHAGVVLAFVGIGAVTYALLTAEPEPLPVASAALATAPACKKTVTTVLAKPDGTSKTIQEELPVDCETGVAPATSGDGLAGSASGVAIKALIHLLL